MDIARYTVLAGFAVVCFIALVYWAIRESHLAPSNPVARFGRQIGEPLIQPIARIVSRRGGNPQDAPFWLVAAAVVAGLILVTLVGWILNLLAYVEWAAHGGARAWIRLLIDVVYFVLVAALVVRVVGSWLQLSRRGPVVGFAHRATDWIVLPIRGVLPALGPLDLSPLVAWLLLMLIRVLLTALLL